MFGFIVKLLKLPFAIARGGGILFLVCAVGYHAFFGHAERLHGLPDGKSVLVAGVVRDTRPAEGDAGGGAYLLEDVVGFVEVVARSGSLPAAGAFVLLKGEKWTFTTADGRGTAVVVVSREYVRI